MDKFDSCFTVLSNSKLLSTMVVGFNLVMSITLIVLSVQQSWPTVPDWASESDADAYADACQIAVISYISPFHVVSDNREDGCPWRVRNTIFRCIMVSLLFMASVLALMALFRTNCKWNWPAVCWAHWVLFVMMFVVFVLDADGVNSGYSSCKSNFKVDVGSDDPVSIWYTESGYKCDIAPFIWTVLLDLGCCLTSYAVYKVATLYASSADGVSKTESTVKTSATKQKEPESNGSKTWSASPESVEPQSAPHTVIAVGGDTQHHIQNVSGTDGNTNAYGHNGGHGVYDE